MKRKKSRNKFLANSSKTRKEKSPDACGTEGMVVLKIIGCSIFSDALGSTSDAVAEIDERTAHLLSLTLVETALATVSVNTIHFMVEP